MKRKMFTAISAVAAAAAFAAPAPAGAQVTEPIRDAVTLDLQACITPVVPCALATVDAYYAWIKSIAGNPPPLNSVCYIIWGRPCTTPLP